jgi:hypothetical protein
VKLFPGGFFRGAVRIWRVIQAAIFAGSLF